MKNNLLKTIIVVAFITIMTTVIYAFNRYETTLESDVAYTIEFDECIGFGACTEYGTALVAVSGYTQNDVAVWTSTYTRMEGNTRDYLLKTVPQTELDLAEEAKDQCPVGAIY
jgi:ferredoxin